MKVLEGLNVNEVFPEAVKLVSKYGVLKPSRNGPTLEIPEPVASVYHRPWERVLFCPVRNANPFFHFFEALWILAGRKDVATLKIFNSRMLEYSDDGATFHAAYGHRLRYHWGIDQIQLVIRELQTDMESRRAVLQIWDAVYDLGISRRDIPCNDTVFFKIRSGALHMTVCNRSNDLIWGAYGANVVQFSILQEYIAWRLGVEIGPYTQVSDSLHVYIDNPQWGELLKPSEGSNPYFDLLHGKGHLFTGENRETFDGELKLFMCSLTEPTSLMSMESRLLNFTALPLYRAWKFYKERNYPHALYEALSCQAMDWRIAAVNWLNNAEEKRRGKAD